MKAGIYLGKEQIEIWELPLPEVGGFSEYILIPNAKRNHSLYAVDERISDKLASLIEPFTVGCRAARRGMIPCGKEQYVTGQNAVAFGCGEYSG